MGKRGRWERLRRHSPSWALSLVLHLGLLALFAAVTWVVAATRPADPVLSLGEDVVSEGGDSSGAGSSGTPDEAPPQPAPRAPAEATLPETAPPAEALDVPAPEALAPRPLGHLLTGKADPASALMRALDQAARTGSGTGIGDLAGTSSGFGEAIRGLRKTGLDVVLVLDATDSMSPYIEQAKKRLREVVGVVTHLVPDSWFGVVAYKDYGDDYGRNAVRVMKLSKDPQAARKFINEIVPGGGGDEPEPVNEALAVVADRKKIGWRPGRKRVVILAGDSSIHASGRPVAFRYARQFATKLRGTINVIDVGGKGQQGAPRQAVKPDLARVAKEGGGSAFLLTDREAFWRHLVISVFGHRFEQDVNTIIRMYGEKE